MEITYEEYKQECLDDIHLEAQKRKSVWGIKTQNKFLSPTPRDYSFSKIHAKISSYFISPAAVASPTRTTSSLLG